MSRIGKQPIIIPSGTEVKLDGINLTVKGPKGSLVKSFPGDILIKIEGENISLAPKNEEDRKMHALWGTHASLILNMIEGVNEGYSKKLILEGVGFRSEVAGNELVLSLGFSHPVKIEIPEGLTVTAERNNIVVSGIDKELVGHFSALVRSKKKPEPYKGKGFRYEGEVIRRKQGKKAV